MAPWKEQVMLLQLQQRRQLMQLQVMRWACVDLGLEPDTENLHGTEGGITVIHVMSALSHTCCDH
jgi:hypothetical protein